MKAKREHEVPLSDAALALLESMPKVGEIVFAGTKKQILSDMLWPPEPICMRSAGFEMLSRFAY